jgi:hypothetical protein
VSWYAKNAATWGLLLQSSSLVLEQLRPPAGIDVANARSK